jgi:hypothetical protein
MGRNIGRLTRQRHTSRRRLLGNRLTGLLEHIAEDAALVTEVG